jgi:ketosteroid isomerase-like protein
MATGGASTFLHERSSDWPWKAQPEAIEGAALKLRGLMTVTDLTLAERQLFILATRPVHRQFEASIGKDIIDEAIAALSYIKEIAMEYAVAALYRAMLAHDLAALDGLLAEDVVYIHSTGLAETKAAFLDGVRDGLYEYERVLPESQRIVESGDLAMVYAVLDFAGGLKGMPHPPTRLITTLVWRRMPLSPEAGWRLILRQATRIP